MKSTLANEDNQIESLEKSNNKVQTNPLQNLLKLFKKKKNFVLLNQHIKALKKAFNTLADVVRRYINYYDDK